MTLTEFLNSPVVAGMASPEILNDLVLFLTTEAGGYKQSREYQYHKKEGSFCAFGAYLDSRIVQRGYGVWIATKTDNAQLVQLHKDIPYDKIPFCFIGKGIEDVKQQNKIKLRLHTLNDTTDLTFIEIGAILEEEKQELLRI